MPVSVRLNRGVRLAATRATAFAAGALRGRSGATAATAAGSALGVAALLVGSLGVAPRSVALEVLAGGPGIAGSAAAPSVVGTAIGALALPVPAGAVVVSPSGSDRAAGTAVAPLRTLARAVLVARPGGVVVLRGGTYHESVMLPSGKALTLQNWPHEAVWMDGTRVVGGWVPDHGGWRVGWTLRFDSTDPSGLMVGADNWAAGHPAQVFVDGLPQYEVLTRAAVRPGTFFVDAAADRFWIGSSPIGHEIRVTDLTDALYVNGGRGTTVRGIGFQRYATPLARMGMVKGYADDVTFSDCAFRYSSTAGLSLNGLRARVLHSTFTGNGQLGVQGNHTDDLVMVANDVRANNRERFLAGQAAGGIKITQAQRVTLRGNVVGWNWGDGIWLDESVRGATVVGNVLRANLVYGLQFEISAGLVMAGNTVVQNVGAGVRVLESNHVRIWNNVVSANPRGIDLMDGARVSTDLATRGHDARYGYDPYLSWEVDDVSVQNNVLGIAARGSRWAFGYDDARHRYSGYLRHIVLDHNGWYSATAAPGWLAAWGDWPVAMRTATTFAAVQRLVRGEGHGVYRLAAANPWAAAVTPIGAPLPADVAAALGLPTGALLPIGAPAGSL